MAQQWHRMNKATPFDERIEAMRMITPPMFKYTDADEQGTISSLYNALLPIRAEGYDWTKYPPFDNLPKI